ncbi:PucR family transcriptional regulator [Gracilibacillus salinarum]|uniref:PucR family transcriptional regulator n=1 Tax=Gracilibacillus salinarum TaxID=2932255 RepID=A0ABY4GIY3_9BACI|nr:PucR family transcriptional regulator [Gracilibacillus salinarum]UOQ84168.1 PucR family transcriptional regulator [Gracilibacillus salinarum]
MHLTIKEALGVFPFSQSKLVAGTQSTTRWITAVNIMDAPDIQNWVKKGELLFTTAFIWKDNLDKAINIIKELENKQCAGLGIKLGRYWKEIPQAIIDIANKLDFPIFELPYSYTFSDQIKALYDEAHLKKEKWLHDKLVTQKELLTFQQLDHDFDDYLTLVARFIQYPFTLLSADLEVLHNYTKLTAAQLLQKWQNNQAEHISLELIHKGEHYGYLFILDDVDNQLTKEEEMLFDQIGEIVAAYLSNHPKSLANIEKEVSFQSLLKDYTENRIDIATFAEQLTAEEQPLTASPYWTILLNNSNDLTSNEILILKEKMIRHPYFKSYLLKFFTWQGYPLAVVFDPNAKDRVFQRTNLFLPVLEELLHAANIQGHLIVSRQHQELAAFPSSVQECTNASRLAKELDYNENVIITEDLDFFSLYQYIPDHLMETFYQNTFDTLLHDSTNFEKDMLATLETYIECNGNLKEVANRLFVHRNTVVYRLDKISNLLQIDLKNIDDLLRVKMALTFIQLKNIRKQIS